MIYFVRSPKGGPIKIGTTIRLSSRIKQLIVEHGELVVLAVTDGSFPEENSLHQRFAHLRTFGEWFDPGDDLLGFIASEARKWDGSDDVPRKYASKVQADTETMRRVRLAATLMKMSLSDYVDDVLVRASEQDIGRELKVLMRQGA